MSLEIETVATAGLGDDVTVYGNVPPAKTNDVETTPDAWTLVTVDRSLAAHFEHTVLVMEEGCEVLA